MHHLHIFLSSPGDVNRERQLAREVIDRIQSEKLYKDQLKLEVVAWDKPGANTAMPAQLEPQGAINQGLKKPSECDIVIVILWSRMGTPLPSEYTKPDGTFYLSGTEYEFIDAMNVAREAGKPDLLVYRCLKEPSVTMTDPGRDEKLKQWDLIEEFFSEFRNPDGSFRSFYKSYNEPHEFRSLLERDLRDLIERHFDPTPYEKSHFLEKLNEPTWDKSKPPFPGLRPFTPDEASVFYGRDREIDQLIQIVGDSNNRFTAVVGASGSGKSSLVNAGLLPRLAKDAVPGSRDWVLLRFTPGEVDHNPFLALINAFKPILEKPGIQPRKLAYALEVNPSEAGELFNMALDGKPEWAELLFFIDQFEEFFTLVDPKYQQPFVDLLALASETARVRTVVAIRSDFYNRCLDWPVLSKLFADNQYNLLSPSAEALYEMITRPAEKAGYRFEDGLPNRILDDAGTEPEALELMAFALYELWRASPGTDSLLTHASYGGFNGIHGAIGKRAEDTFKRLESDEKTLEIAFNNVFSNLVVVDERGVATRRKAVLDKMPAHTATSNLVEALIDASLLVASRGKDKAALIEVSNEAIFTHWPRLKDWIEGRRDNLHLMQQVRQAAAEWDNNGRSSHFLWPYERLLQVAQVLEHMRPVLSPLEQEFIRPESDRLLKQIDDPATTHQQRVKIGDRLSEIGDPRPGVRGWGRSHYLNFQAITNLILDIHATPIQN